MKNTMHEKGWRALIAALFTAGITTVQAGDVTIEGHLSVRSNLIVTGVSQFGTNVTVAKDLSAGIGSFRHLSIMAGPIFQSGKLEFQYKQGSETKTNYIYAGGDAIYTGRGPVYTPGDEHRRPLIMGGTCSTFGCPIWWRGYHPHIFKWLESKMYPNLSGEPVWENCTTKQTNNLVWEGAASVSLGGDLTVRTNLTVNGEASINRVRPMGDIAMGIYTNTNL